MVSPLRRLTAGIAAVTACALCLFVAVSVYTVLQYYANLSGAFPQAAAEHVIRSVWVYCLLELPLLWASGSIAPLFHWPHRFARAYFLVSFEVWVMTLVLALIAGGLGYLALPIPAAASLGLLVYPWGFDGVARLVIGLLGLSGLFSGMLVLAPLVPGGFLPPVLVGFNVIAFAYAPTLVVRRGG